MGKTETISKDIEEFIKGLDEIIKRLNGALEKINSKKYLSSQRMEEEPKMEIEFNPFPKIARLSRDIVITEKIDGTNGSIYIGENGEFLVGSRTRWITPGNDNMGFAKWCYEHKDELLTLGKGHHFGEWWGNGIQRGYGLPQGDRRFSLFNVHRWCEYGQAPKNISTNPTREKYQDVLPSCVRLVPILYEGVFDTKEINNTLDILKKTGSVASPGYMNPEGIVIYHTVADVLFKKTIEKDDLPKSKKEVIKNEL